MHVASFAVLARLIIVSREHDDDTQSQELQLHSAVCTFVCGDVGQTRDAIEAFSSSTLTDAPQYQRGGQHQDAPEKRIRQKCGENLTEISATNLEFGIYPGRSPIEASELLRPASFAFNRREQRLGSV